MYVYNNHIIMHSVFFIINLRICEMRNTEFDSFFITLYYQRSLEIQFCVLLSEIRINF